MIDFTPLENLRRESETRTVRENNLLSEDLPLYGERRDRERMRAVYREYQDNIRKAEEQKSELLKGIKRGTDESELLLIAVECIAILTHDQAFKDHMLADIDLIKGLKTGIRLPSNQDGLHSLELMRRCIDEIIK